MALEGVLQRYPAPGGPDMTVTRTIPGDSGNLRTHQVGDSGRSKLRSNEVPIMAYYLAMPWDDGSHQLLKNGAVLFVSRQTAEGRTNLVEWSKLNDILRLGTIFYKEKFGLSTVKSTLSRLTQIDNNKNGPNQDNFGEKQYMNEQKAIKNLREKLAAQNVPSPSSYDVALLKSSIYGTLRMDGEKILSRELEMLTALRTTKSSIIQHEKLYEFMGLPEDEISKTFKELCQIYFRNSESYGRYGSVLGIVSFWNFLGVLNNTSEGKGVQDMGAILSKGQPLSNRPLVINVCIQGQARTPNRWGDNITQISRCYAVLTRKKLGNNTWGDYQLYPWASKNPLETPPLSLLLHEDYEGNETMGHFWLICGVDHRNLGQSSETVRLEACGLSSNGQSVNVKTAFQRLAQLENLEVFVKPTW